MEIKELEKALHQKNKTERLDIQQNEQRRSNREFVIQTLDAQLLATQILKDAKMGAFSDLEKSKYFGKSMDDNVS